MKKVAKVIRDRGIEAKKKVKMQEISIKNL